MVDEATGVDLQVSMTLSFSPTSNLAPALDENQTDENTPKMPGARIAFLSFGMLAESIEETVVLGNKGRLTIKSPSHCPTRVTVSLMAHGRGHVEEFDNNFSLPEDTEEITNVGGYFYPNSAGFCYEAAAVAHCIAAGKTEAPQYTLQDTLVKMTLVDEIRSQLGVKPTGEPS